MCDNAPIHCKSSDDALNVQHMNVRPGGKQPKMRETVFNGEVQQMVLPDGRPKGMKMVLQERGVDTKGMMNAQKMRETLSKYLDFASSKTIVQIEIEARGHLCMFFPKFHCELNASEKNWCHAKKHSRKYSNGSITRLRKIVCDTCTPELNRKFF